jgi:iron complex outermembrane receptor protein
MDYSSGKWRLGLDAYGTEERYSNGSTSMYELSNGVIAAPDGSTNLLKGSYGASENNAILFKGEYDFTGNLTAYAGMGTLKSASTGSITGNHARNVQLDGTATVRRYNQNWWTDTLSSEYGLRGKFKTGAVNHQLVLGYNMTTSENGNNSANFLTDTVNIYNPVTITTMAAAPAKPRKSNDKEFASTFFADTLSFDKDKVQLTLGLREQKVTQRTFNVNTGAVTSTYESSATTPVAGVVVKPWGNSVALYASYIEGLSPGQIVGAGFTNAGEVLAPYKSKQQEFGVKWDKGDFANTLAFYQITKPSQITVSNVVSYDGEQKNSGIEWTYFGKVAENVRLLGGITYMQGKLVRTNNGTNEGNTPYGIPQWMINAGAEWDTPWNRDLTLSLRAVYTSSQYINSANTRTIPNWIRYDLGARYKTTINQTPVTFYASVENVFNKNYWASSFSDNYVTLGGPRTFKLSAAMQF